MLKRADWIKIGKGALLAGAGAAVSVVLREVDAVEWGSQWDPIVGALVAVLLNILRKL